MEVCSNIANIFTNLIRNKMGEICSLSKIMEQVVDSQETLNFRFVDDSFVFGWNVFRFALFAHKRQGREKTT